jgi:diadenosine tetraphosphate (Ap4A) HIT family hydrolase
MYGGALMYDPNNIFAKILRGEIPNKTVFENDWVLAFEDISPQAKVHILVIPKGEYTDMDDFSKNGKPDEIVALFRSVHEITEKLGLDKDGYRLISNCKIYGGQEVPHLHLHIMGGEPIGPLRTK